MKKIHLIAALILWNAGLIAEPNPPGAPAAAPVVAAAGPEFNPVKFAREFKTQFEVGKTVPGNMWADAYMAEAFVLTTLASSRLLIAQAALVEANAMQEIIYAQRLNLLTEALARDLSVLQRNRQYVAWLYKELGKKGRSLDLLKIGHVSETLGRSLDFFTKQVLESSAVETALFAKAGPFVSEYFHPRGKLEPGVPFLGGNVGDLFAHIIENKLVLEPFSPPHLLLLTSLDLLEQSLDKKMQGIGDNLAMTKKNILAVWDLTFK